MQKVLFAACALSLTIVVMSISFIPAFAKYPPGHVCHNLRYQGDGGPVLPAILCPQFMHWYEQPSISFVIPLLLALGAAMGIGVFAVKKLNSVQKVQ